MATAAHRRGRVAGARCRRPAQQRITRTTRMRRARGMYLVLDVVLACARIVTANPAREHTVHAEPAADALAEQRHAALLRALMRTNTRHVRQRWRARTRGTCTGDAPQGLRQAHRWWCPQPRRATAAVAEALARTHSGRRWRRQRRRGAAAAAGRKRQGCRRRWYIAGQAPR